LPEQLRILDANAAELIRQGRHDDAERVVGQIVASAPRHVPGLQYLAGRALARNDLDTAQSHLEQAIRCAPRAEGLHQNLGIVLRAKGFPAGALKAFGHALRIAPDMGMIWIQMGDVLQALGRHEESLAAYCRGERILGFLPRAAAASGGRVRRALMRAARTLQQGRVTFTNQALDDVRSRYPGALDRAEQTLGTLLKLRPAELADPLQRPELAYFPGIEASPFYDRGRFRALQELEAATDEIRGELSALLGQKDVLSPYVDLPTEPPPQWQALNGSVAWGSYHLYKNGERVSAHCKRCPATHAAIEALPLPRVPGQSPEAFFSILEPGTHIPPHCGLANYKLTVHLPLIAPAGCSIRVGDETRGWTEGECLVFDDSFEHEAWNKSESLRAVLILEAWHPDVTEPEREFLATAVAAVDRFNRKQNRLAERLIPAAMAT